MKRISISILIAVSFLCLPTTHVIAQPVSNPAYNIPVTETPPTGTVTYPGLKNLSGIPGYNYIRKQTIDQDLTEWPANPVYIFYRQTTDYFDGLGRPLQTVSKKAHAAGHDILQHHVYDTVGREQYQYLPVAVPVANSQGNMRTNVLSQTVHFYSDNIPVPEQPYSCTQFDNAQLNRPVKQLAPGKSWVGSNRGVDLSYQVNKGGYYMSSGLNPAYYYTVGAFPRFTIGNNPGDLPVCSGNYNDGELTITNRKDEDGKVSEVIKDKQGRTLIERSLYKKQSIPYPVLAPPAIFPDNYTYTIYVYDDLDRLRTIISPEACKPSMSVSVSGNNTYTYTYTWPLTAAQVDGLCYSYVYDSRGRNIEKKLPGKEWEYFVYDKRNRLVYSQDGNLRAQSNKWSFKLYDGLNRTVCTGLFTTGDNRSALQAKMDGTQVFTAPDLKFYQRDYTLYHTYPASMTDCDILSYTYYDDYEELNGLGFTYTSIPSTEYPSPVPSYLDESIRSSLVNGLVTGTKVRILDPANPNPNWLTTINYYDNKQRIIQSQSQNHKGGIEISSNIYYFQGMLFKNILQHNNPDAEAIPNANNALTNITYSRTTNRGIERSGGNEQVRSVTQQINGGIEYPFCNYYYDHMGRVVVTQLPVANVLKEYNTRGFITHINVADSSNINADSIHIFEERLFYDRGFASKLYNGNIAGITWRKAGIDAPDEAYGYSYDALDRLNHAEYRRQDQNTTGWINSAYDYTVSNIGYDLNGNLKSMSQKGMNPSFSATPIPMDQLAYSYRPNTNMLIRVKDSVPMTNTATLPDFKDNIDAGTEYGYDANGNMVKDDNKKITDITYNHLNKPVKITIDGQGDITYVYDASGERLQKRVHNQNLGTDVIYDYINGFVYKDNVLQYILNDEGRARPVADGNQDTKFIYDYYVKDHLGNVRSTVTAEPETEQYLARHEIAYAGVEERIFSNIPQVRDYKPGSRNPDDVMAARVNGGDPNRQVGTAIMLRVMPGDRLTIRTDAYYDGNYKDDGNQVSPDQLIASLMNGLLGGQDYNGVPIAELPENARIITTAFQNPQLSGHLSRLLSTANSTPNAPKAHLNYLFFNENMELVEGGSSITQVPVIPMGGNWANIVPTVPAGSAVQTCCMTAGGGYVVVYVDNQSVGKDVWFDNLMIEHYNSKVQEENHYYPFGLTISSTGPTNMPKNHIEFQGQQHDDDLGLNMYSFKYRDHDPQIGRFWQVDPLAEDYPHNSTYAFSENKVTGHIELEGLESLDARYGMNQLWRSVKSEIYNLFSPADNASAGYQNKLIVEDDKTTTTITTTTETRLDFSGWISNLMYRNSSSGYSLFSTAKTTVKTEGTVDRKIVNAKFGVGNASASVSTNQADEQSLKAKADVKIRGGFRLGLEGAIGPGEKREDEISLIRPLGRSSARLGFKRATDGQTQSYQLNVGVEFSQKKGKVRESHSFFLGWGK